MKLWKDGGYLIQNVICVMHGAKEDLVHVFSMVNLQWPHFNGDISSFATKKCCRLGTNRSLFTTDDHKYSETVQMSPFILK